MTYTVHPIDNPAIQFKTLALEAEREGFLFVGRLVAQWEDGTNRFDMLGEMLIGVYLDAHYVGVCGMNVDPYLDDERVGRLRHLYVADAYRNLGIAKHLVARCMGNEQRIFERIRLRTNNPAAAKFYENIGFVPCEEQSATHVLVY